MTEAFQIILAVVQVLMIMFYVFQIVQSHRDRQVLGEKRDEVIKQQSELKETLSAMNKFHNENVEHKKQVDAQLKSQGQQLSALTQSAAAVKPSFMR